MPAKQKPKTKPSAGRPPSPYPRRSYYRHNDQQMQHWKLAAATCGVPLQDWMIAALDGEAYKPHHTIAMRIVMTQPIAKIRKGGRRV